MTREPLPHFVDAPDWVDGIPTLWARTAPAKVAVATADATHDWADLERQRLAWAERLRNAGVRPGDRVLVIGENGPAAIAMIFAVLSLRAWLVNVNARLSAREVAAIHAHAGARLAVFLTDSSDARAHAERMSAMAWDEPGWGPVAATRAQEATAEPVSDDPASDVAALLYTTGTTGEPKGVMLTHANLMFIARNSRALRRLEPRDRVYGLLPISHVYGLASVCLGTLFSGASLHPQARFQPAAAADFLRRHELTVCQGVPAMYAKLLEHLRAEGRRAFEAPALRFLYAGGSPLAPQLKRDVEAFFGLPLHNGYGLTEASPTLTQTRPESPRDDCSVGPAIPGVELRVVDREGHDVPRGQPGELWARGPNVMKGYYRAPEATAQALRPGGWLATGDIARQGDDGAYFIEGRLKELIIRSGFNVFPVEVEAVLNAHPEVVQSAVVGRSVAGDEEVVAFVELVPGARVTPEELVAFAGRSLAPYKRPAEVVVMAALPAAPSGKVLKGQLARMLRERPVA
jgi:long-chain acyl-CoA synthetase